MLAVKRIEISRDYLNRQIVTETEVMNSSLANIKELAIKFFDDLQDEERDGIDYEGYTDVSKEYEISGVLMSELLLFLERYCGGFNLNEFKEDRCVKDYNYSVELF